MDKILSLTETAHCLGINVRSLQRLFADGSGPPTVQLTARRIGVLEPDLERWVGSRRRSKATVVAASKSGKAA